MSKLILLIISITIISAISADNGAFINLEDSSGGITLGNGLFNITLYKNGTAKSLHKNNVNLIHGIPKILQTWYFDWDGGKAYFTPSKHEIIEASNEKVHFCFIQEASPGLLHLEFHLVIFSNLSGIYQYIKASNPTNATISLGELRTAYRFDHKLMPKVSNSLISGYTPDISDRPTIQDTTWQLADGTYWSKYDFCGYLRETPWQGVYGGGFGGWLISPSREYHSGGPLKQELLVHHDSIMLNYFHSAHFGTPGLKMPPGWSKFYGPYLVYINTGSDEEVQEDVRKQFLDEQIQWPYSWVVDEEYPLTRGSVYGEIKGQTKAMVVVYSSIEQEFDAQTLGYLYHNETDVNGSFIINNIRPGDYQIVAYPLAGQGSENLARQNISVTAGSKTDIGSLALPEPTNIMWSLGETNRKSSEYRYSDELRGFYWHLVPPANLTFTIGSSRVDKDWYYAQTKTPGFWKIAYNDQIDHKNRTLRVAFAAASRSASITIEVNGHRVGHFAYDNDDAVYRDAMQSGNFHQETITVSNGQIVNGRNVISFQLLRGMVMYDAISLASD